MAKLAYIKEEGVTNLSYSRLKTLHECPRKFELQEKYESGERTQNIHTEFGHAYAMMVQEYFRTRDINRSIVAGMAAWDLEDLWIEKPMRSEKCFEEVLLAFDKFVDCVYPEYFEGRWKLADLGGIPAIEPLCYINILDMYSYQMHIDLILQNEDDSGLMVVEIKTTERSVHPAMYGNSSQATNYSIVVDYLAKKFKLPKAFQVMYLVYNPKQMDSFGHNIFEFPKSPVEKIQAINSILLECQQLEKYEEFKFYPKNGDSCYNFNRACGYYNLCDMKVLHQAKNHYDALPKTAADICIDIENLAMFLGDVEQDTFDESKFLEM